MRNGRTEVSSGPEAPDGRSMAKAPVAADAAPKASDVARRWRRERDGWRLFMQASL